MKQMLEIHKAGFIIRQRRFKVIAGLSYVVCGIFFSALIYIISIPYYGVMSPVVALCCAVGSIASYVYAASTMQDALTEAQGMAMFDTIKPEDLENL